MNHSLEKIKNLIAPNDSYIIFVNGERKENNINKNIVFTKIDNVINININNDTKIKIFHIINQEDTYQNIIKVSENVTAEIYEYFVNNSSCQFSTKLISATNSNVNFLSTKNISEQVSMEYSFENYSSINAHIQFNNLNINKGEIIEKVIGVLEEKQSSFNVYSVNLNNSNKNHKIDIIAHHKVGYNESNFKCLGIANNNSRSIVNTIGIIENGAGKSQMSHNIKGILLDHDSDINTNPILQIDEFDVIASHGASVGNLSDDEIYYLMSRGLTYNESQKLIISGLVMPILDIFNDDLFHQHLNKLIIKNL